MAPYRPPGRSNRSGRSNNDNDVFEGLPVKQWSNTLTKVSLAPPVSDLPNKQGQDRWGELPMPRDFQLLAPYTQEMLRLARRGKIDRKRKADDEDGAENTIRDADANATDETNGTKNGSLNDERAFVAKKWRQVPDHSLVPEHQHLEFLAKRRKGLPNFYHDLNGDAYGVAVPLRKTKVHKLNAETGEVAVYEILVPEGQPLEGEIVEGSQYAEIEPTKLTPGVVMEGLGTANDDGVLVAEVRNAAGMVRRNRPPPKKKGGPGRGKKRVTFTNPDGSTYTTIVPNATKIVPQPGQTVKHVAKGEEAAADVTAEEAASMAKATGEGGEDDEDDEEGDEDEDEEGDERGSEEGEVADGTTDGAAAVTLLTAPSELVTDSKTETDIADTSKEPEATPAEAATSLPEPHDSVTAMALDGNNDDAEASVVPAIAETSQPELEPLNGIAAETSLAVEESVLPPVGGDAVMEDVITEPAVVEEAAEMKAADDVQPPVPTEDPTEPVLVSGDGEAEQSIPPVETTDGDNGDIDPVEKAQVEEDA